jgi:hypothetical protein
LYGNDSSCFKEHEPFKRIHFYIRVFQSVHDGKIDPRVVFFSDEAWFPLRGEMNSPNSQYWSSENSELIRELPLHDPKKKSLVCDKCTP